MYEKITYTELKKLPEEQKADAWKELMSLYSTKKELASKLGASQGAIYNMISKYVGGKSTVSNRTEKREEDKSVKIRNKRRSSKDQAAAPAAGVRAPEAPVSDRAAAGFSFSISMCKEISGADAQYLLNGISNALIKEQKYLVELKIMEK